MDATDWDERYAATDLVWSVTPNQFVESELSDLPPGRALDLACGEGRNARWLAERGWQVTALDWSAVGVEKGRKMSPEVDWQVGDALTAPLPRDLDLVVVAYFQVPPAQRRTAVRRVHDALAIGGTLLVVAHDSTNLAEGTSGPQDPEVLYTAEDLLGDLEDRALEVLRAERVARVVPVKDGHGEPGTAWDALLRVRRSA
jgi:SAM-dependent methyltransferase